MRGAVAGEDIRLVWLRNPVREFAAAPSGVPPDELSLNVDYYKEQRTERNPPPSSACWIESHGRGGGSEFCTGRGGIFLIDKLVFGCPRVDVVRHAVRDAWMCWTTAGCFERPAERALSVL
jgi:hypothetical protein